MDVNWFNVAVPIATFVLGFFTSRFTMSKAERKNYEQTLYQNANELIEKQRTAYDDFTQALARYVQENDPNMDNFVDIATTGDRYFLHLKMIAEATLANRVDSIVRDQTIIPTLKDAIEKSLPKYYETLQEISRKKGFKYDGVLERNNYESIYSAVEKYA